MEMAGSVRLLLKDGPTLSWEFFYLALLSFFCCNYFVLMQRRNKLNISTGHLLKQMPVVDNRDVSNIVPTIDIDAWKLPLQFPSTPSQRGF